MSPEAILSTLTVIGPDRNLARPLHDERVVHVTVAGTSATVLFESRETGAGRSPHLRFLELALNPNGTHRVTRSTETPMPNPSGPGGREERTGRKVATVIGSVIEISR